MDWIQHDAIACPLCDYTTGISKGYSDGEKHARIALAAHLRRKKHARTGQEARALARDAKRITQVWSDSLHRFVVLPLSVNAGATPSAQGAPESAQNSSSSLPIPPRRTLEEERTDALMRSESPDVPPAPQPASTDPKGSE